MSNDSRVLERGTAAYIIASVCVLTGLSQFVAALVILGQPAGSEFLSTANAVMRARILLPLGITISINLITGVAVYLMRIEALACMGFLLARLLGRMAGTSVQFTTALDLSLLLVLIYFTIRMFAQSSTLRGTAPSGWRHPLAMLFLGLTTGHLTLLITNLQAYAMLIPTGALSPVLTVGALIGCGALYVAVMMMQSRPDRAKKFFLFAALAMGLSLPAWSHRYGFSAPFLLGAPLAILGFGLVRYLRAPK
jgi:hypothetical protein